MNKARIRFRRTLFISILGHIVVFSIFNLSFGSRITPGRYVSISFWGQCLRNFQVTPPLPVKETAINSSASNIKYIRKLFRRPEALVWDKLSTELVFVSRNFLKPPLVLAFNTKKEVFTGEPQSLPVYSGKRQQAIIFHPLLPYGFTLYFKDRQIAHVELMFKIVPLGSRSSLAIKRKISSGNLEVDLLTKRYIGHYLFIRQPSIATDNWQTVKIDLSAEEN